MHLLLWLLTLGALDDIREQIRWNGLTPDQQARERIRERRIDLILWCLVLIGAIVIGLTLLIRYLPNPAI
jgi:hypothetical protein